MFRRSFLFQPFPLPYYFSLANFIINFEARRNAYKSGGMQLMHGLFAIYVQQSGKKSKIQRTEEIGRPYFKVDESCVDRPSPFSPWRARDPNIFPKAEAVEKSTARYLDPERKKKKKNYPSMLVMPSTFESNVTFVRKKKKKISFLFNYFSLEGYAKLLHIRKCFARINGIEHFWSEERRGGEVWMNWRKKIVQGVEG